MLEKQWTYNLDASNGHLNGINVTSNDSANHSAGRSSRISIVVQSVGCNVPGGLEALLRVANSSSNNYGDMSAFTTVTNASSSPATPDDEYSHSSFPSTNSDTLSNSLTNRKGVKQLGSRLLRVAKGTTDRIERGMAGMAIRADQGKRPDWTCASCYITTYDGSSGSAPGIKWEHIGNTDSLPVNNNVANANMGHNDNGGDQVFHIPLVLSDNLIKNLPPNFEPILQIRLLLRSGAGLLNLVPGNTNKTGGVGKYYTVGTANFRLTEIIQQQNSSNSPRVISTPIQSPVQAIHNVGQIVLSVLPDTQFPPPNTLGYSLTDPNPNVCHPFSLPFHPPLHQSYAHKIKMKQSSLSPVQVGVERAIESTVVLPCAAAVTNLLIESASVSSAHANSVLEQMKNNQHIFEDPMQAMNLGHAQCSISMGAFWKSSIQYQSQMLGQSTINISLQKPTNIFEQSLGKGEAPIYSWNQQQQGQSFNLPRNLSGSSLSIPFYPKVHGPASSSNKRGGRVGTLVFEVLVDHNSENIIDDIGNSIGSRIQSSFEGVLNMDEYLHLSNQQQTDHTLHIPVYDRSSNFVQTGVLAIVFSIKPPSNIPSSDDNIVAPDHGIISLMGMHPLTEKGSPLDSIVSRTAKSDSNSNDIQRHQQLKTMGDFTSLDWMQAHACKRAEHVTMLKNRYQQYVYAISHPQYNTETNIPKSEFVLPNEKKEKPSPFRPSSAKKTEIMAGIPINVHVQSVVIENIEQAPSFPNNNISVQEPRVYANITCGACADHPAGYKYGGLRRLEMKREELAEKVKQTKTELIMAVQNYFRDQANTNSRGTLPLRRHVPIGNLHIAELRAACIEAEESLAALTWECALRRGNVISQGIAIALTSLLSSISNLSHSTNLNEIYAKTELWKRHGYLLCFEGLLTAAGKELGMIEDTSVAIDLLNTVAVQFVSDTANDLFDDDNNKENRIPAFGSQFIKWISLDRAKNINQGGHIMPTSLVLTVGMDPSYYASRFPESLRNRSLIRFYAVLFEMGVDIRQWGANTSAQARLKIADAAAQAGANKNDQSSQITSATALDDDEDDEDIDSMDQDNDILKTLNMEGFRKLNLYANAVFPQPTAPTGFAVTGVPTSIHPLLGSLWEFIRGSSGKMQHGVIDAAAAAATNLSGGGIIFCKSGKDRTAMQVTLQQAQFLNARYLKSAPQVNEEEYRQKVYEDATLMRVHGTRLAICEKNVGQPKYAFNALQVKFMPEMLKPPFSVLAGFLKGGQVFTGKGFIES